MNGAQKSGQSLSRAIEVSCQALQTNDRRHRYIQAAAIGDVSATNPASNKFGYFGLPKRVAGNVFDAF